MGSQFTSGVNSAGTSATRRSSSSSSASIHKGGASTGKAINQDASQPKTATLTLENELSLLSLGSDSEQEAEQVKEFNPSQCLFCNTASEDLSENLGHMQRNHGLFIPDESYLIVGLEVIVEYFHLVIFGYSECLYCGSQRSSPEAAQQHMIGKAHCKIDISSEESEFRDFYDFDSGSEDSDDENPRARSKRLAVTIVDPTDKSIRLTSGKTLSHRSAGNPHTHKLRNRVLLPNATSDPLLEDGPAATTAGSISTLIRRNANSGALTRSVKQERTFQTQLASLRAEDRRSLMHLTLPQQRAVLAKSKKQVERARKEENEMKLKIQLKANKTAKK